MIPSPQSLIKEMVSSDNVANGGRRDRGNLLFLTITIKHHLKLLLAKMRVFFSLSLNSAKERISLRRNSHFALF